MKGSEKEEMRKSRGQLELRKLKVWFSTVFWMIFRALSDSHVISKESHFTVNGGGKT
jgi:hypothetical protein